MLAKQELGREGKINAHARYLNFMGVNPPQAS